MFTWGGILLAILRLILTFVEKRQKQLETRETREKLTQEVENELAKLEDRIRVVRERERERVRRESRTDSTSGPDGTGS